MPHRSLFVLRTQRTFGQGFRLFLASKSARRNSRISERCTYQSVASLIRVFCSLHAPGKFPLLLLLVLLLVLLLLLLLVLLMYLFGILYLLRVES